MNNTTPTKSISRARKSEEKEEKKEIEKKEDCD